MTGWTERLHILCRILATHPHRYHVVYVILLELAGKQTPPVWIDATPSLALGNLPTFWLGERTPGGSHVGVAVLPLLGLPELLLLYSGSTLYYRRGYVCERTEPGTLNTPRQR